MLEDVLEIRHVVLACRIADLRKGIDGLAMIIGDKYKQNCLVSDEWFPTCFIMCRKCPFFGLCGTFYYLSEFVKKRGFCGIWCSRLMAGWSFVH